MALIDVYNLKKEKISEIELSNEVFDVPIKKHVLHQVVVSQIAKRRSGTASTKSRSEVKYSGAKLWRQKGTGRARAGSAAAPGRRGGGVAFGPAPRNYVHKVPKKVRKTALCMALTDKLKSDHLIVVDKFELPEIKTKDFVGVLKNFGVNKALIVTQDKQVNLEKSSNNVPLVKVLRHEGLNPYDILKYEDLLLEQSAIENIEEALVS
ncbi:MAG: 50S ribosomal protein L4 [Deltaproteobacteria bacterium]|nr:50S ribosomal protein L4 [Deltaproteobacteria bacterium]